MTNNQLQGIIEGALLAAGEPLSVKRLMSLFPEDETPEKAEFEQALQAIDTACQERGFALKQVASGWRLQVREEVAPWVNRLWDEKPQKYSRALLETLALIAYRQPITRGDIEEIRGVAVSSNIIKTLTEREWVKVVGQRDVPGRPSLYATTRQFLDYFNLKSLDELPTLSEIRDLDEINNALDLRVEGEGTPAQNDASPAQRDAAPSPADSTPADSTPSGASWEAEASPADSRAPITDEPVTTALTADPTAGQGESECESAPESAPAPEQHEAVTATEDDARVAPSETIDNSEERG